ncbi:MAG: 50S ribosomal protein L13 [Parcubacteria group bacterium GW2011_GWA2_56_7]|nr:MAG: 50S ribosomal protein L13 [Parcubacteria group bacterium GW2011_GWA2_56_7]
MDRKTHIIDANGKKPGRLATEVAFLLQGKHKPTYTPHLDGGDFVEVVNVERMAVEQKKAEQKVYQRHSMHPGGLKEVTLEKLFETRPKKVLELAVAKMLPKNKLRAARLKRLTFKK